MKKNSESINLEHKQKEKIDLNIIPPYFFILNTFVLFSFLIILS